ncbi:unnamed protein product [Rotaria sp. Silwood1]|nr:unnamed protein product [Rotaria sp. Silwood1]
MSRRAKQILAAEARKAADGNSFVPVLFLSELDVSKCSQEQFLEILTHFNELCANRPVDQRSTYVEQVYHRLLHLLSQKVTIPFDRIVAIVKQLILYCPVMAILTLDDLKKFDVQMEKRSLIIHFDMSGSMNVAGFNPLVQTIIGLCTKLQSQGIQVHVSLFGDDNQERIHDAIGGRLLTLDEFSKGKCVPNGGGTNFCPSFRRTRQFSTPYDAIIVSDGAFTGSISQLTFQEQCHTVFFVAPPWSPLGVEEKHAKAIASSVHPNVPYIGIASEKYPQLDTIIEGEIQLQVFIKRLLGLFRYLEETAKLNFERCIRGDEFRNLMSLVTPLIKTSQAHLETSNACQQLYGYLTKILKNFALEQQKLIKSLTNDHKAQAEFTKFWDDAMSFSERALIIEENERKYGQPIGYLNVHVANLTCTSELLSEALQQLKTLYSPEDPDHVSLILDTLENILS